MKLQVTWLQLVSALQPAIKPFKGQLDRTLNGGFITELNLIFPVDIIEYVQAFFFDHFCSVVIVPKEF